MANMGFNPLDSNFAPYGERIKTIYTHIITTIDCTMLDFNANIAA
jgi:hypothetical protein